MLTGNILFPGGQWMEMLEKKRGKAPSQDWPKINVSRELRDLIHGALQPDVKDRKLDLEAISKSAETVEGLFGSEE